ncbi:hypothetical protein ACWCPF_21375 [Streptomyces sp. NPDC001858]
MAGPEPEPTADDHRRAYELWTEGRRLLDRRTEPTLTKAVALLTTVLGMIPATELRALVHHDVSVGHWRLVRLGIPGHAVQAVDHALLACQTDVGYVLQGSVEDFERDVNLLADTVRLEGVDLARLRAAQAFLDRHRLILRGLSAHGELQQAVAEGRLQLMGTGPKPILQEHVDEARDAFERTLRLLDEDEQPDRHRIALTLTNRSFLELLSAHGPAAFHNALDLAFAAEEAHPDELVEGASLRVRVLACLHRSGFAELPQPDRWRLRLRLWRRWAGDWLQELDEPTPDDSVRPPLSDWFGYLLAAEAEDIPLSGDLPGDAPLPAEVREYASALLLVGGYPLGLVVILMGYRLGGRVVPPEELVVTEWQDAARDPSSMGMLTQLASRVAAVVLAGQRGEESALPELMSLFASLDAADVPEAAGYFLHACMELAASGAPGARWDELLSFMYDLALRLPESERYEAMFTGWRTIMPVAVDMRHERIAARWTRELVRLAEHAWRSEPSDVAAYDVLRAELQAAKVRTLIEGDDMDDVVADLGRRVEEHRRVDEAAAVALEADLIRVRALVAQECADASALVTHHAGGLRLMAAHPELNLGSWTAAAVNLINAVADTTLSTAEPFGRETALAARTLFDDLPGVLSLGERGVAALAALTQRWIADLAGLGPEDIRLATAMVRTHRAEESSGPDVHVTTQLGTWETSLVETLKACARYGEQGHTEQAAVTLLGWLLANADRPVHDRRARLGHWTVAKVLEEFVRASEKVSEPIKAAVRYAVGECAHHAGLRDVAREYLSLALEEARSMPDSLIPADAIESDYAMLMIESAASAGDRAQGLHWLRVLLRSPMAELPPSAVQQALAVTLLARKFGPEDLVEEAQTALRALRRAVATDTHRDMDMAVRSRAPVRRAELLLVTGDTVALAEILPELDELARAAMPALEAHIRQIRVSALMRLGDVRGIRAELDRLTFLQDEAIGVAARFDELTHDDHCDTAQLMVAAAAADANDIPAVVEVLEQGRLRLLRRLRLGIDEETADANADLDTEGTDLSERAVWDYLAARASEPPPVEFGIAREDWQHIFQDIDAGGAVEVADRSGIVTYQFVHDGRLRMVHLIAGRRALTFGPLDIADRDVFGADNQELLHSVGWSWASALRECADQGFAPQDLRPILIAAGERPELALFNEQVFAAVTLVEFGEPRRLNHLPSVRFAQPREPDPVDAGATERPARLLHIGDASNTLLGPWLEAAALREIAGLEVRSLLGSDSSAEMFGRHLPDASVIVASCHGAQGRGGLLGSSLMIGADGLSVLDIATKHSLAHIDMLFLASCEMGRRLDEHHERESVSFSNAALVSGCRHVVAPILPVNDLISALVVAEFGRRLPADGSLAACQGALDAVRAMTRSDAEDRMHALWERLAGSPLAERMPWPVKSAARVLERGVARALRPGAHRPTFCISKNG